MRPKPMQLENFNGDERFVRDQRNGLVWHRTPYRVLYADTDCSGAVYHSNHLRYFELGRATLMRDVDHPYSLVEERGYVYPIVKTALNYYQSLTYDELIWVLTRPSKLERVRIRFDYAILKDENPHLVADGYTLHCALNSRRIPVAVDEATYSIWKNFPR